MPSLTNGDAPGLSAAPAGAGQRNFSGMMGEKLELSQLTYYLRIIDRRKWVIAGIVLSAALIGLIVTSLMTRQYSATATLEIARQQDKIVDVKDVRQEASGIDQEFYQTQYSLLKARSVAEGVVARLRLADNNKFFEAFGADLNEENAALGSRPQSASSRSAERRRRATEILLNAVTIAPNRGSRLVAVTFTSPDPQLSTDIVNAWTQQFIDSNLARRFDATSYARRFLEERLQQLRQKLEESERQLVGYATAQRIINVTSSEDTGGANASRQERPIATDDLVAMNKALSDARADRIQAESRLQSARSGVTSEVLNNGSIGLLRQKRAELSADRAKLLAQYEPTFPGVQALSDQISELDRSIGREEARARSSVVSAYSEARQREAELLVQVNGLKTGLLDLRTRSIQYNIYQREVETNRDLYNGLLQRYKEIGIAGGVGTNNVTIVDAAQVPEQPSSPNLMINLALAIMAGLVISGLAVFALEQIDETLTEPADLPRLLGLPTLGVIPDLVGGITVDELLDRKSQGSESYLSALTSIRLATNHGLPRTIAVTSTRPAEGKSTSSLALALSLAQSSAKVLLIDGDMRSPSVHSNVDVPNKRGLSNFLAGDDDFKSSIIRVERLALSIMPAGPLPPNAGDLLTGPRLPLLLQRALEVFDYVVIDSPPVVGLADAPLIASTVESVIYIVEANGSRANQIKVALERLSGANSNVIGGLLTRFKMTRSLYGYGYDYGYGYGDNDTKGQNAG